MTAIAPVIFYSLCGLAFGSFANVYFFRVPNGLSIVKPNSFCPQCKHPISWFDNIPILSYMLLGGKCRFCGIRISIRYPLIEGLCGLLFFFTALKFNHLSWFAQPAFIFFAFIIFLTAGIDLVTFFQSGNEYGIIPDHLILPLFAIGLLFCPFNPLIGKWWMGLLGSAAGFAFMILFRWAGEKIFKRESLGLGDVKLISAVGIWLGWEGVYLTIVIGSILGTLFALPLMGLKKLDRNSALPFGPFLAAGSLGALLFYDSLHHLLYRLLTHPIRELFHF